MESRNKLAKNRTSLANERTFLAFVRTALMIFVSGVTFIKLFHDEQALVILGYIALPVAVMVFIIGLFLFLKMRKNLRNMDDE